jgi:hypothetical protein
MRWKIDAAPKDRITLETVRSTATVIDLAERYDLSLWTIFPLLDRRRARHAA